MGFEVGPDTAFEEALEGFFARVRDWLRRLFRRRPVPFADENPFTEYEEPGYPDGGPLKGEPHSCYHRRKWDALDPEIKDRAVTALRDTIPVDFAEECREYMERDPDGWMIEHHMTAGMWIRNELRRAVIDKELPTGNWDDYYVRALEEAIGGAEPVDNSWEATAQREEIAREAAHVRIAEELRKHLPDQVDCPAGR